MSEETLNKDELIASLLETVENQREEIQQVRINNRILRRVHSALRTANQALKNKIELAEANDQLFRQFCNGDFDAKVMSPADGGLPDSGTQVNSLG